MVFKAHPPHFHMVYFLAAEDAFQHIEEHDR